jgi:hypothetical protein
MIDTVEKLYVEENWTSYKMTLDNGQLIFVPLDEANTDYQAIQEWISAGNTVIDNPPE